MSEIIIFLVSTRFYIDKTYYIEVYVNCMRVAVSNIYAHVRVHLYIFIHIYIYKKFNNIYS